MVLSLTSFLQYVIGFLLLRVVRTQFFRRTIFYFLTVHNPSSVLYRKII